MTCSCPHHDAIECARIRHLTAFDDIGRATQMEEADVFDSSDGCKCKCHPSWRQDDDDEEEVAEMEARG